MFHNYFGWVTPLYPKYISKTTAILKIYNRNPEINHSCARESQAFFYVPPRLVGSKISQPVWHLFSAFLPCSRVRRGRIWKPRNKHREWRGRMQTWNIGRPRAQSLEFCARIERSRWCPFPFRLYLPQDRGNQILLCENPDVEEHSTSNKRYGQSRVYRQFSFYREKPMTDSHVSWKIERVLRFLF